MIRFVIILPLIVVTWLLLMKAVSDLKKANIDWTGVTTIIGFIRAGLLAAARDGNGVKGSEWLMVKGGVFSTIHSFTHPSNLLPPLRHN
ncbi:hypothetical protein [Mesorhizobium sp.]|uniref:hypothetical protein n=1 Tax=Mesorhizobium sp. TaxID=1871066 RepID=UPI0025DA176A|nr:hypothetical protein [Mesorhizobium sp.]